MVQRLPEDAIKQPASKDHFCEMHDSSSALSASVSRFVQQGLEAGDAVVVIAAPDRLRIAEKQGASRELRRHSPRGELVLIESAPLLKAVTDADGHVQGSRFEEHVLPILRRAKSKTGGTLRVYGEMVNDLVIADRAEEAIRLEALWNKLAERIEFELFCGYVLDSFERSSYGPLLEQICATHHRVQPTRQDESLRHTIDSACLAVIGSSLSTVISASNSQRNSWERQLPLSRRMMMWLFHNMPSAAAMITNSIRQRLPSRAD